MVSGVIEEDEGGDVIMPTPINFLDDLKNGTNEFPVEGNVDPKNETVDKQMNSERAVGETGDKQMNSERAVGSNKANALGSLATVKLKKKLYELLEQKGHDGVERESKQVTVARVKFERMALPAVSPDEEKVRRL